MKVKDLINKLENADPEQEVYAVPLIFIPILQSDGSAGNFFDDDFQKIATPFESYSIEQVGLTTDLCEGHDKGKQYVCLGYTTNEQSNTLPTLEFVN